MLQTNYYKVRRSNSPTSSFEVTIPRHHGFKERGKVLVLSEIGGLFVMIVPVGTEVNEKLLKRAIKIN